ncbi:MAG: hypothetical protein ACK4OM_07250 [Alphaproteobacteria bacterium]
MQQPIVKIEAADGQIYLFKDRITIARKGIWAMLSHGIKPSKDIVLKNIISVDFQPAGFNQGVFYLNCIGSNDKKEYTLKFNKKLNEQFSDLKEKIFELTNNSN